MERKGGEFFYKDIPKLLIYHFGELSLWTFIDGNPLNIDAEMLPLFLLVYTEEEEEALILQIMEDSRDEVESDPEVILISPWDCGTLSASWCLR